MEVRRREIRADWMEDSLVIETGRSGNGMTRQDKIVLPTALGAAPSSPWAQLVTRGLPTFCNRSRHPSLNLQAGSV